MAYRPRCRWCGSDRLVWRHDAGILVCAECGGVLETLMEPPDDLSTGGVYRVKVHDYERDLERILERGLSVEWVRGKPVGVHPSTEKARKMAESLGLDAELSLIESDVVLKARPLRSRIALAIYLRLVSQGYTPGYAVREAARLAGVNEKHLGESIRKYRSRIQRLAIRAART